MCNSYLSTTKESHDYEMLGWKNSWLQKDIFNTDSCLLNQEFGPDQKTFYRNTRNLIWSTGALNALNIYYVCNKMHKNF